MKINNNLFNALGVIIVATVIISFILFFATITYKVKLDEDPTQVSVGDIFTVTSIDEQTITIKYITHTCNWEDCKLVGKPMKLSTFKSTWNHEPMSTGYLIELVHFMNPDLTYEQCEEYVISGVE